METREKQIEIVAKAMCRTFYSTRSIEEAVAPSVQLWQRFEKEATVAVDALLQSSPPGREAVIDVDWLANVIRVNSGDHLNPIGAGALAEKIVEAIRALKPAAGNEGVVPHLMECGDIVPALENLLTTQAAYARQDGTSRAQRDVARKAFDAELESYLKFRLAAALSGGRP